MSKGPRVEDRVVRALNTLRILFRLPVHGVRLPAHIDGARSVIALIHDRGGSYGISFPDFPGCVSSGRTQREAIWRGANALSSRIQGMLAEGEPIPHMRRLLKLRQDPAFRSAAEGGIAVTLPIAQARKERRAIRR